MRRKFAPILPNRHSPHQTPASLRVDLRYAELGIVARWDWDRYLRLAAFLNYTPYELASVICIPHGRLWRCQRRNRFPGPAALLLTLLEAQAMKDYSEDIIANPFPR